MSTAFEQLPNLYNHDNHSKITRHILSKLKVAFQSKNLTFGHGEKQTIRNPEGVKISD